MKNDHPSLSKEKMASDLIVMILMSCSKQNDQISSAINLSKRNDLSIFSKKKRSSLSIAKCKFINYILVTLGNYSACACNNGRYLFNIKVYGKLMLEKDLSWNSLIYM